VTLEMTAGASSGSEWGPKAWPTGLCCGSVGHFVDQQQRRVPTRGLQPAWWPFASAPGNVKSERASRSGHSNQT